MLNWDKRLVLNVSVLDRTHSRRETREETGLDEAMADHTLHSTQQLDYILVDRKHMYCSREAEANGIIHMGSNHRSVMAKFVITAPKKEGSQKIAHRQEEKVQNSRERKESGR